VQPGNYSYYLEKRQAREQVERLHAQAAARDAAARQKAAAPAATKPRKLTLAERKELEGMEEAILVAEEAVAELEAKLSDPEFQKNYEEIPVTAAKLDAAKAKVAKLYARWEELEAVSAG